MAAAPRRPRWSWATAFALAAVGVAVTVVRPVAPSVETSALGLELATFPAEVLTRVAAWVGPIRLAYPLRLLATVGVPLWLVASGRGRRVVARLGGRRLATVRGALVPPLAGAVAAAPLTWWIGWRHAGAFGFQTSTPLRFVTETLGGVLLAAALTAATGVLLLWLRRRRPHDWPAIGTLLGTVLTAVLVLVQPLVVAELLYHPVPLEDAAVEAAVAPVLERSTLPATELLVGDASVRTTRVNAFVSGLGPTKQVLLWDTLLALPPDRVAAVVGHEVAHAEHLDLPRGVLGSAAGILLALLLVRRWSRRVDLPPAGAHAGALVVTVVLVLQVLAQPVVAFESRRVEAAADARALELTRDPAGLIAVNRGFVTDDLSDPRPPAWVRLLSSHPTAAQRIAAAVAFAEASGLDPRPAVDG